MHDRPNAASTTPPSGREPDATATPKPPIRPAAASGAVGTRASCSAVRRSLVSLWVTTRSMIADWIFGRARSRRVGLIRVF